MPEPRGLRRVVLRFAAIATIAGILSWLALDAVGRALLVPLYRAELAALDDHYRILRFELAMDGAERVFLAEVGLARDIELGGRVVHADPRARARVSTLAAHPAMALVLVLSVALAIPARSRSVVRWRVCAIPVAVLLLWTIDVPMLLWANLWSLHVERFEPDRWSGLIAWSHFMEGGGRLLLGVLLGAMAGAVGSAGADAEGRSASGPSSPMHA